MKVYLNFEVINPIQEIFDLAHPMFYSQLVSNNIMIMEEEYSESVQTESEDICPDKVVREM